MLNAEKFYVEERVQIIHGQPVAKVCYQYCKDGSRKQTESV